MNTTLWIIQAVLAAVFFMSGTVVYLMRDKLKSKMTWLTAYSSSMVLVICLSKIAGAIGLILPLYLGIATILTPLAAVGLAIVMALAFAYHLQHKEYKDVPATVLFFALSLFVAYGRF
ncbi:DoxX-like family protein [Flexibacter flexilis DSM 6793]|uniref:DoxX-like family protein n=1 Tax=Flexibacter flexilis DSM 6793 TaxID=927664 RepID=A0A1I1LS56_9BACT|nr:DoxX family protein [Flexibacter flexilis]SFC75342.1 DoxX-like family protein [Flexibacter flexilis DSM 6793]